MNILCIDTSGRVLNFSLLRLPETIYPDVNFALETSTEVPVDVCVDRSSLPYPIHSVVDVLKSELQINPTLLSSNCIPNISPYTVTPDSRFVKRLDVGGKMNETLFSSLNLFLEESGLHAKDIDEWVCILGPGSLTGIRVGLAALTGITVGLGKPLYGISTFDAATLMNDVSRGGLMAKSSCSNCDESMSAGVLPDDDKFSIGGKHFSKILSDVQKYNRDAVTVCVRLRQREYACRSYDYNAGSSTDITIEELVEVNDFAGRLLINSGNNSSAGIYLSEAIFHSKVRDYYMEPTPMYIKRSEAELNFDKSSNKR